MLASSSVHLLDDNVCLYSTYISESRQAEIDKMLLEARHQDETYKEAYEKARELTYVLY